MRVNTSVVSLWVIVGLTLGLTSVNAASVPQPRPASLAHTRREERESTSIEKRVKRLRSEGTPWKSQASRFPSLDASFFTSSVAGTSKRLEGCLSFIVSLGSMGAHHITKAGEGIQRTLQLKALSSPTLGSMEDGLGLANEAELLQLEKENVAALEHVLKVVNSDGWQHVASSQGITVMKKKTTAGERASEASDSHGVVDPVKAAKFDIIMAKGTLNARPEDLFALFKGNDRVHEYNDNCKDVEDLHHYEVNTKVSWACTPRYGPFKARDFVTVVNYRRLTDGTLAVVNRPIDHAKAPKGGGTYQRAEILIATNMMTPHPEDSSKTNFIVVSHINPGGIVDNAIGAQITNRLSAQAPIKLLKALEAAANRKPAGVKR